MADLGIMPANTCIMPAAATAATAANRQLSPGLGDLRQLSPERVVCDHNISVSALTVGVLVPGGIEEGCEHTSEELKESLLESQVTSSFEVNAWYPICIGDALEASSRLQQALPASTRQVSADSQIPIDIQGKRRSNASDGTGSSPLRVPGQFSGSVGRWSGSSNDQGLLGAQPCAIGNRTRATTDANGMPIKRVSDMGETATCRSTGTTNSRMTALSSWSCESTVSHISKASARSARTAALVTTKTSRTTSSMGSKKQTCNKTLRLSIRPDLVRGVGLGEALSRFGRHFASQEPSAFNYDVSTNMETMNIFYSHSWSDSRWTKIVALFCTHNSMTAFWASLVFSFAMCILQRLEIVPSIWPSTTWHIAGEDASIQIGSWCFFGSPIVFLIFVAFGQSFAEYIRPPFYVFLDKLCIHQTDKKLKQAGINGLGGILKQCEQMVVLWTPNYFDRLWCMFEVAVWCSLNRADDLLILPLAKTMMVPTGMLFLYMTLVLVCLQLMGLQTIFFGICVFVGAITMCVMLHFIRGMMRELLCSQKKLANFKMTSTKCSCCEYNHIDPKTQKEIPCDREVIMNTICALFPGEDSCAELDRRIRTDWMQRVVETLGGPDSMPLRGCLIIVSPMIWLSCDIVSAPGLGSGKVLLRVLLTRVIYIVDGIAWIRIFLFTCCHLARQRNNLLHDVIISCCGFLIVTVVGLFLFQKTLMLQQLEPYWPQLLNGIIVSIMVYLFFFGKISDICSRRKRRLWPFKKRMQIEPEVLS